MNNTWAHNKYTKGIDKETYAKKTVDEKTPWLEYVGNYTSSDGFVDVRCKNCGAIFRKSFVSIRHGVGVCDKCYKDKRHKEKQEREQQRTKYKAWEKKTKRYKTLLNKRATQLTFKVCPICGNIYTGTRRYCSDRCRNQNRWRMKDGYRYLFPLEEVYKRSKGICYICGGLCDWDDYTYKDGTKVYGNNYPSRDHIVPKSKGGENTWENIRLAHRICNSLKSDSPSMKKDA